jgi:uncharacterized protein (DUF2249 family)
MATVELDNRGLSQPEPMMRILAALTSLAHGDELIVQMDREPLLLYAELERRGFDWAFEDRGADGVLTVRHMA